MGFFALEAFIGYVRPQSRGTRAPHQSVCVQRSGGGEDGATSENSILLGPRVNRLNQSGTERFRFGEMCHVDDALTIGVS